MTKDETAGVAPDRIDFLGGDLDDVVLSGVTTFRMERMSDDCFWIRCYRDNGPSDVVFWLKSSTKIEGSFELEPVAAKVISK